MLIGDIPVAAQSNRDRGAVTVEAAIGLIVLVVFFVIILAGIGVVTDQLRCVDAAREIARLTARGEQNRAESALRHIAPAGAAMTTRYDVDAVQVTVEVFSVGIPGLRLRATAFAVLETSDNIDGVP